jgi:hypothetical protein
VKPLKKAWRLVCLCLLIGLAACQTNNEGDAVTEEPKVERSVQEIEAPETEQAPSQPQMETRLHLMKVNMTEEEVRSLYGPEFTLVQNAMEGNETWRYEINARSDYHFDDQGIDMVDLEGLKKGHVQELIFVDWDDSGRVQNATLYIKSEDKGHFEEYRLKKDGSIDKNKHILP